MHGTRADITRDERPVSAELPLHVKVPVQDVSALRILVNVAIPNLIRIKADVRINTAAQRGVRIETNDLEGRSGRRIQAEFVRQRQNIKYPEASADSCLSIPEGIPGKTNAWLKVFRGGVVADEAVHVHWPARAGEAWPDTRRCAIDERGDLLDSVVGIVRPGCELVAQSNVERQIRAEAPIVLNIPGEQAFTNRNFIGAARSECVQPDRRVVEQIIQRRIVV